MKRTLTILALIVMAMLISTTTFAQEKPKVAEVKILTSAVCSKCKDRIEQNIAFEKGVIDVNVDLDTKIATIKYKTSKTDTDKLRLAISKLGFDADNVPADKTAHEKFKKQNEAK